MTGFISVRYVPDIPIVFLFIAETWKSTYRSD